MSVHSTFLCYKCVQIRCYRKKKFCGLVKMTMNLGESRKNLFAKRGEWILFLNKFNSYLQHVAGDQNMEGKI